jgi:hypothetical protein
VFEGQDGPQVFVVEGDRAVLRKVVVARAEGGIAVIESGLAQGETVVSSGHVRVRAGGRVAVKNTATTAAAAP